MTEHVQASNNAGPDNSPHDPGSSRERPWLLPSNRKLRHLDGISLRNLILSRPASGNYAKTIDDDSLPHALRTPTKALALRETHKLEHSRSSVDLKSAPSLNGSIHRQKDDLPSDGPPEKKSTPPKPKARRRSTLNWTNALPAIRQKKLEDVAAERLADTFFSLHCADIDEPVYVSEVMEKTMNPSFRFFDLNTYGPWVTRRDHLTIKYWAQTRSSTSFFLLIELEVHLRSLQFIGKSLESFRHPLPANCILFHLTDGIYTSFTDLPIEEPLVRPSKSFRSAPQIPQPTSTFDSLMRLSNLDDCIQDALSVREKLSSQITSLIDEQHSNTALLNSAATATASLDSTNRAVTTASKALQSAQTRHSDLQASLAARRAAIASGTLAQEKAQSHLSSAQTALTSRVPLSSSTKASLTAQTRRIASSLLNIYPIDPILHKPLHFTIRSLPLPPASQLTSSTEPEIIAAALGHAAHLTHLLSHYLSTALPYPLTPHGSTSTVYDSISTTLHSTQARTFPLYAKGAVAFRFEYGVFLLNKDIEALLAGQGIRLVELRHTAGNLRLLLSVLVGSDGDDADDAAKGKAAVEEGDEVGEAGDDGKAVEGKGAKGENIED